MGTIIMFLFFPLILLWGKLDLKGSQKQNGGLIFGKEYSFNPFVNHQNSSKSYVCIQININNGAFKATLENQTQKYLPFISVPMFLHE